MRTFMKWLIICISLISSPLVLAAGDSYPCYVNTPCAFNVDPQMGRHIDLSNIAKSIDYACTIIGSAAIGHIDYGAAKAINLVPSLTQLDMQTYLLTLDASQLNVSNGDIKFDAENYNMDIPANENITCVIASR
jgi:hypothetical protein